MSNHERPEKLRATAFDGLAAALSPALIIGMIGSLVFFLVIAFYRGQYDARLMYILALYTAATVLVARIAIESDRARAAAFAVPLAIAAMLGMMRFVTINGDWAALSWIVNIGLLGLTYYLADRITFDCTLLEEDRESLQGGLLQTIGSSVAGAAGQANQPSAAIQDKAKASKQPIGAAPLKKAKHNPGVWVLYFALIAFPLFGVGQLVIPDERQRSLAFWCLVAYLGCALALLMTTSLLGMRRYLRQRGALMPPDITAKWLVAGGLITCAILVACMLMPLPGKQLSVAGLKIELTSPDNLTTSKFGWGNDGKNDGQAGQATEQSQGEGAGNQQGQENQQGLENKQGNAQGKAPQGDQGQPSENGQGQSDNSDGAKSEPSQSNEQNRHSSLPSDKGQQPSTKGNQGQPGRQEGQANDPTDKPQQGTEDRSGDSQNASENKGQNEQQSATKANDPGNKSQGNEPKNNRNDNKPNDNKPNDNKPNDNKPNDNKPNDNKPNAQPNKQPNNQPQAEPQPDQAGKQQAGKQPPDEPNPNNNQPQPAQAAPSESEPLRAGNSLSQTSRSLASTLLDTLKTLGSLFKWLLIAVLAGIVIFFVVTHFEEVKRLITDLMNFINALMGRRTNSAPATQPEAQPSESGPIRRPFSAFPNPFSRSLQGWQGPQVVQHTFAALEAWAAQRGRVRAVDQTAEEFARKLVAQEPELERLPLQAASMLDRVMFAGWQPSRQEVAALEHLWDRMSART